MWHYRTDLDRSARPLFFLKKIQLFGFRIDGIPRQLNFLIDEYQTIGSDGKNTHGPNVVLSLSDRALQSYGSNKPLLSVHSDYCPANTNTSASQVKQEPGSVTDRTGRDAPEQVNILKTPASFRFLSSARPESIEAGGVLLAQQCLPICPISTTV